MAVAVQRDPLGFGSGSPYQLGEDCFCDCPLFPHHPPWLLFSPGFLSLLEHKQSIRGCACLTTIDKPVKESQDLEPSGTSVTVVLLPERTVMP